MAKAKSKAKSKGGSGYGWKRTRTRAAKKDPKSEGNPFFALRVDGGLLRAFRKAAAKAKVSPGYLVRAYMGKVTGIEVADEDEE